MTWENEPPGQQGSYFAIGKEPRNGSRKMKTLGQSRNDTHLWMCLVVKVKSDAIKNNIVQEIGTLGPRIKVIEHGQEGGDKSEYHHFRNQ